MKTDAIQAALRILDEHATMRCPDIRESARAKDAIRAAQSELDALALRRFDDDADRRAALRDTFAAAALTGISSRGALPVDAGAVLAYHYADAMLKAREAK